MMIQIDPDDTELKDAIHLVEQYKKPYDTADKAFDRFNKSSYLPNGAWEKFERARKQYESVLVNLALIFMERL